MLVLSVINASQEIFAVLLNISDGIVTRKTSVIPYLEAHGRKLTIFSYPIFFFGDNVKMEFLSDYNVLYILIQVSLS